ncbi:MAG TPA: PPC domain-containing protein [Gemmatimonadales bacterium]|nr:PPC domain-containing protein [Gemmatimonadales bacterium]
MTLDAPSHVVLRGQDMSVYAQAWRVSGVDTQAITNVAFDFASGSSIALVKNEGGGYATVTGVNSGNVDIVARAVSFEKAEAADLPLRISSPLEIDSVRPKTARYGQVLTVYGVGVDSMFLASLGGANLIEYPFSRLRDPATGLGRISFWVPPPARTDSLFYLGSGVFGYDTAITNVLKDDIFEPNDTVPSLINLDAGGPWPGTVLAPILWTNPALAFEPVDRATLGIDWFRFSTSDTTQALTFFIKYPSFGDTAATRTFLIDSLAYNAGGAGDPVEKFYGRPTGDYIGSDFYHCQGYEFDPAQVSRESTTVALKTLPSHAIHIITFFSRPQRYGLTVAKGYFTADSRIQPDKYEENDFCHFVDSIPGQPNPPGRIHVSTVAFSDTMNIDNPFEIDWYRLEVPSHNLGDSVLIRLQGRPFVAGQDSSDIDIYVLTVPGSTGNLTEVDSSIAGGSSESILADLPAGSYYLAVVDYAGVAERYSMCVREIMLLAPKTCNLILPGPPAAGPALNKRRQQFAAPLRSSGASGTPSLFGSHRQQ